MRRIERPSEHRSWPVRLHLVEERYGGRPALGVVGFVIVLLLVVVVATGALMLGAAMWDKATCKRKADAMRVGWQWSYYTGCLVRTADDGWVPLENLRHTRISE